MRPATPARDIAQVPPEAGLWLPADLAVPGAHDISVMRGVLGFRDWVWNWKRLRRERLPPGVERHRMPLPGDPSMFRISPDAGGIIRLSLGRTDGLIREPALSGISGAWDDEGAVLWAPAAESERLRILHRAAYSGNLALYTGSATGSVDPGLYLFDISRTPDPFLQEVEHTDSRLDALWEKARTSVLERKLRARGIGFQPLIPRWVDSAAGDEVEYWVQPLNTDGYRQGWFRSGDIELWLKGEGPIVKTYAEMGLPKPAGAYGVHDALAVADEETGP